MGSHFLFMTLYSYYSHDFTFTTPNMMFLRYTVHEPPLEAYCSIGYLSCIPLWHFEVQSQPNFLHVHLVFIAQLPLHWQHEVPPWMLYSALASMTVSFFWNPFFEVSMQSINFVKSPKYVNSFLYKLFVRWPSLEQTWYLLLSAEFVITFITITGSLQKSVTALVFPLTLIVHTSPVSRSSFAVSCSQTRPAYVVLLPHFAY